MNLGAVKTAGEMVSEMLMGVRWVSVTGLDVWSMGGQQWEAHRVGNGSSISVGFGDLWG